MIDITKMKELLSLIQNKSIELSSIDQEISQDKYTQLSEEIKELVEEYKVIGASMLGDLTSQQKTSSDKLNQAVSQLSPDEVNKFLDFVGSPQIKAINNSLDNITKEVNEFLDNLESEDENK